MVIDPGWEVMALGVDYVRISCRPAAAYRGSGPTNAGYRAVPADYNFAARRNFSGSSLLFSSSDQKV
jgi:hypothetical protein